MCQASKAWLEACGCDGLALVDNHDIALAHRLGVADLAQLNRRICLLLPEGRTLWGYDAIVGIIDHTLVGRPFVPLLQSTLIHAMATWLYDWVARHRGCAAAE